MMTIIIIVIIIRNHFGCASHEQILSQSNHTGTAQQEELLFLYFAGYHYLYMYSIFSFLCILIVANV